MKTLNFESTKSIFNDFSLSADEMINVRGGKDDGDVLPPEPPIEI